MKLNLNNYTRNLLTLFSGNAFSQLIPFLLAPIVGRLYTPAEMGTLENFIAIGTLISIIGSARYEVALVLPKEQQKAQHLLSLSFGILLIITLISGLLIFFADYLGEWYRDPWLAGYVPLLPLSILLFGVNNITTQWMIRQESYRWLTAARILQSLSQYGSYALLGYAGWGLNGLFAGLILGNLVPALLLYIRTSGHISFFTPRSELTSVAKEYRDFPLINSTHAFTDIFITQFFLFWLITRWFGPEALGLFAVMNRYLKAPVNLVSSALGQLFYKESSKALHDQRSCAPEFYRTCALIFLVAAPFLSVIFIWGPDLFGWYLGAEWKMAGEYARLFAPTLLLYFIISAVSSSALLFREQKRTYMITLAGHILTTAALVIAAGTGKDLYDSLAVYSISLAVFYAALFAWYRHLIKKKVI